MSDKKKIKPPKKVLVSGTFPELPAKVAQQAVTAEGPTLPKAVAAAVELLLKRDGIKRKRIRLIKLNVEVLEDDNGEAE